MTAPRSEIPTEFGVPIVACFLFLLFESAGRLSELALTAFIIIVAFLIFVMKDHKNELSLFVSGVLITRFGLYIRGIRLEEKN